MKVVIAEPLAVPSEALAELLEPIEGNGVEVVVCADKPRSLSDWVSRCEGADVVVMANTPFPSQALVELPRLKYLNVAFTGTDHVPVKEAKERGIIVSNATGYSEIAVSELCIGMTIGLLRDLRAAGRGIRQGEGSTRFCGQEIHGKIVGILGTGHIGLKTAKLYQAFGAKVIAWSRTPKEEAKSMGIPYYPLEKVLEKADIISVHLPLTEETAGLLGEEEFARMKRNAVLVNCARGPIVDSNALAKALSEKRLRAAVDVFEVEPPMAEHPLFACEDALLTPHIGYFTEEAMLRRAKIVLENVERYLCGQKISTQL